MCVTEIEFLLGVAKSVLPGRPAQAAEFASRALGFTHNPHLRLLILPAISALERRDAEAARKCLDRATEHITKLGVRGKLWLSSSPPSSGISVANAVTMPTPDIDLVRLDVRVGDRVGISDRWRKPN